MMLAIRAIVFLTIATVGAGCSTNLALNKPTGLPEIFVPPEKLPDFVVAQAPASVAGRLRKTKCGGTGLETPTVSLAGSRPEASGGIYLDSGATPEGTRWFLVRAKDDPDRAYCGIALAGVEGGTNVSVLNVGRMHMGQIQEAVESGDFFCRCKGLAR